MLQKVFNRGQLRIAAQTRYEMPVQRFYNPYLAQKIRFDALPRLKPVGFGGDSADSIRRCLTICSRPETASRLMNIYRCVAIPIMYHAALTTRYGPLTQRHVLKVSAATHQSSGRLEAADLREDSPLLLADPLLLQEIVAEPKVTDLAAPERLHAGKVQVLKRYRVKPAS